MSHDSVHWLRNGRAKSPGTASLGGSLVNEVNFSLGSSRRCSLIRLSPQLKIPIRMKLFHTGNLSNAGEGLGGGSLCFYLAEAKD